MASPAGMMRCVSTSAAPPSSESAPLPRAIRSTDDLAALERAAERVELTGEQGPMVWHAWRPAVPANASAQPPVVLLHGGSGSWTHWARNIAALVYAGRQVWVPDLPGFGDSARPPAGGDADALPAPMEAALARLFGDAAVDLVGFSFGAMVGTLMAAATPVRVRRLVLSGAPALGVNPGFRLVLRPWSGLAGEALEAAHRHNLATLMLARAESIDALALEIHARNLARDRMKLRRLSRTLIVLETLPKVRCPVVGIWGAEDTLYRGVGDRLEPALASAPDFRWLAQIPGAGHWVQYEDWAAYDALLAQALAEPA